MTDLAFKNFGEGNYNAFLGELRDEKHFIELLHMHTRDFLSDTHAYAIVSNLIRKYNLEHIEIKERFIAYYAFFYKNYNLFENVLALMGWQEHEEVIVKIWNDLSQEHNAFSEIIYLIQQGLWKPDSKQTINLLKNFILSNNSLGFKLFFNLMKQDCSPFLNDFFKKEIANIDIMSNDALKNFIYNEYSKWSGYNN